MPKKITIVGGGSSIFTPQLIKLVISAPLLTGSVICLMDIDERRLQIMDTLARGLVAREGADLVVESTTDQRAALTGADYVIIAIAAGGFEAWEKDIETPGRYGVFMMYGDSIGPGGIMRAFRHIPVLAGVAKHLQEVSPNAWIFNYTNPLTANCVAIQQVLGRDSTVKNIGLCTCSGAPRGAAYLANMIDLPAEEVLAPAPAAGLNHCAGIVDLRLNDGRDVLPLFAARTQDHIVRWALEHYHILPYCASHWSEFFPALSRLAEPYQGRAQGLKMQYGLHVYDMDHERAPGQMWSDMAEKYARGEIELSLDMWPKTQAVEVIELIEALLTNANSVHVVNVPNRGAIPNLPDDAVVEISSVVGGYGIRPIQTGPLPEPFAAVLRQHITTQALTVEAALTGDRRTALDAYLSDPNVAARLTYQEASALLDELLVAHARYLPQFA